MSALDRIATVVATAALLALFTSLSAGTVAVVGVVQIVAGRNGGGVVDHDGAAGRNRQNDGEARLRAADDLRVRAEEGAAGGAGRRRRAIGGLCGSAIERKRHEGRTGR